MSARSQAGNGQAGGETESSRRYIESGLALIGLEADEDEIAVIQAVDAIYGPALDALMSEGFDGIPHEPGGDMSRPPRTDSER
jgi:hypothetical protein